MKTAILLATRKGAALSVKFLRHGAFSEILADFKSRVADDRGEPGYDSMEIWTGPPAKTASRLSSGGEDVLIFDLESGGLPTAEQFAEIVQAWKETHANLIEENDALRAELAELKTKFQSADSQGLEKEAQLVGKASGESGSLSGGATPPANTELPDKTNEAGNGEGDLPVAQVPASEGEPQLPFPDQDAKPVEQVETGKAVSTEATPGEATPGEASPGSMSPKKKAK